MILMVAHRGADCKHKMLSSNPGDVYELNLSPLQAMQSFQLLVVHRGVAEVGEPPV